MQSTQIGQLLGLCIVSLIALAGVLLVLRGGERTPSALVVGFPPTTYPAQHLTTSGPLAGLAATQSRLVTIAGRIDPASDSAIWLRIFLQELREIMDTAYRVAAITQGYRQINALDDLMVELQQIEHVFVEQLGQRMLRHDGDAHAELLAGRVATLHLCVRELALLVEQPERIAKGV